MGELSRFSAERNAALAAANVRAEQDRAVSLRRSAEFIAALQAGGNAIGRVALYLEVVTIRPPKRRQSLNDMSYTYRYYGSGWRVTDQDELPTHYIVTTENETYQCQGSDSTLAIRKARNKGEFRHEAFVVTTAQLVDGQPVPRPEYPFTDPGGLRMLDDALRQHEQQARMQ